MPNRAKGVLAHLRPVRQPDGVTDGRGVLTQYGYGWNGTACQGGLARSFVYDTLGRLESATNPESGTIRYNYDGNGNLKTRTDARDVVTTYAYDDLNRVKLTTYTIPNGVAAATEAVTYCYDSELADTADGVCKAATIAYGFGA